MADDLAREPPRIRAAVPEDVALLLELFTELARYEHLEHELKATEDLLGLPELGQAATAPSPPRTASTALAPAMGGTPRTATTAASARPAKVISETATVEAVFRRSLVTVSVWVSSDGAMFDQPCHRSHPLGIEPEKATRPPGQRRPRLLGCPVGRRTTCPTPTGQPVARSLGDALGDTPRKPSDVEFTAIFYRMTVLADRTPLRPPRLR